MRVECHVYDSRNPGWIHSRGSSRILLSFFSFQNATLCGAVYSVSRLESWAAIYSRGGEWSKEIEAESKTGRGNRLEEKRGRRGTRVAGGRMVSVLLSVPGSSIGLRKCEILPNVRRFISTTHMTDALNHFSSYLVRSNELCSLWAVCFILNYI